MDNEQRTFRMDQRPIELHRGARRRSGRQGKCVLRGRVHRVLRTSLLATALGDLLRLNTGLEFDRRRVVLRRDVPKETNGTGESNLAAEDGASEKLVRLTQNRRSDAWSKSQTTLIKRKK